jgi:protein tyrosine phosphatase (PTP) superfamily phosphohydrolase (DUF442 family)
MKRTAFLCFVILLSATAALAFQAPTQTSADKPAEEQPPLPKYYEVTPLIGTGAQPTEAGMKMLAEKGYKSIINFRGAEEMAKFSYEEKLAGELGLKYFAVPLRGQDPRDSQADAFLRLMDASKSEKVYVHCTAANRAGAMMLIQLALQGGMDVKKAEEEARKIGMTSEALHKFALDYIAKQKR